jgi:hypothetical protein
MGAMTNTFWVAANVLFDLETGRTTDVLLLVNTEKDATTFTPEDADTYFSFVQRRRPKLQWSLEASRERPGMRVIKGVQIV